MFIKYSIIFSKKYKCHEKKKKYIALLIVYTHIGKNILIYYYKFIRIRGIG